MNKNKIILMLFCINSFFSISGFDGLSEAINDEKLIAHVQKSIENAYEQKSKLNKDILALEGMSSSKIRHLLNNLCSLENSSYLEIGVWRGSTFISALYQNTATLSHAIAIDNWSKFGGPKADFIEKTSKYLSKNSFNFYEQDSFSIDVKNISNTPIAIYFYDGDHSIESQKNAFTYYNSIFADTFIAVIDDWNWKEVQIGTRQAFKQLEYTILFEESLPAYYNGDLKNWWNGLYIAVIKKNKNK